MAEFYMTFISCRKNPYGKLSIKMYISYLKYTCDSQRRLSSTASWLRKNGKPQRLDVEMAHHAASRLLAQPIWLAMAHSLHGCSWLWLRDLDLVESTL